MKGMGVMKINAKAIYAAILGIHIFIMNAPAQSDDAQEIIPMPSIQTWIRQAVVLETQAELLDAIMKLKQQGINTEIAIQQLIYYQVYVDQIYSGEAVGAEEVSKRAMIANGIIAFLLDWDANTQKPTSSSSIVLIDAILPYLGTMNLKLRKELHHTLKWVDQKRGGERDFSQYESFLTNNTNSVSAALIEYMYDSDARAAVLAMAGAYGDRNIDATLSSMSNDGAAAALNMLINRPEWWAHLYVATVLERDSFLRTPELLEKLEEDTHPLVREKVIKIKGPALPEENAASDE